MIQGEIYKISRKDFLQSLGGNFPEVEGIAGAAVTSDAIVKAAKACFEAAGVTY